jgi:hypothetical protein
MSLRVPFFISLCLSIHIMSSPKVAEAGYSRCQNYPDGTSACIDRTGFKFYCTGDVAGTYSICTGKNNYRKECTHSKTGDIGICNDTNGIRSVCKKDNIYSGISNCENNKGYKSVCRFYNDGNYSICTDVSRWGKPIKS